MSIGEEGSATLTLLFLAETVEKISLCSQPGRTELVRDEERLDGGREEAALLISRQTKPELVLRPPQRLDNEGKRSLNRDAICDMGESLDFCLFRKGCDI